MTRRIIAAAVAAVVLAGCGGDPPVPDTATSEAQVRQRMHEYNLMQITPGSGAKLCSYTVPENREEWKKADDQATKAMRELLPPTVVDCDSNWDHLIATITRNPEAVEAIRTAQVTRVDVDGERATATVSFGGTFEWRWRDGSWLVSGHL